MSNNLIILEKKEQLDEIISQNPYVIVDFYADWCAPCKAIAPVIEKVASIEESVIFVKVNVDKIETLAKEYNISSIPTLIYFQNGKEFSKTFGFQAENSLKNQINNLKNK